MRIINWGRIWLLLTVLSTGWNGLQPTALGSSPEQIILSVKSSPQDQIILSVKSSPAAARESKQILSLKGLDSAIRNAARRDTGKAPVTDRYLTIILGQGRTQSFRISQDGRLYDTETSEELQLSGKWKSKLKRYADGLAKRHYGELVEWEEARNAVRVKNIVTVIDLETGLKFKAQRRAGRHHADVQPVTKKDTKIMKQIYNNQWSWKRRAIIVQQDDKLYAASMHGMPHGGDGIPDNGFSGHFCIHFLNSATHKTKAKDPEHQLMVYKASGRLNDYVRSLDLPTFVDSFIAAVHLQQQHMLPLFLENSSSLLRKLEEEVQTVDAFRKITKAKTEMEANEQPLWASELPVEIQIERKGKKAVRKKLVFRLHRDAAGGWVIGEIDGLLQAKEQK